MKNPKATLHMANGTDIAIELLPEAAPNTVNSFIYVYFSKLIHGGKRPFLIS